MRKIHRDYENFIDNQLLDFVEFTMPFYKKLNMTPNQITFLSLVFALIGSYFYCRNNFYLSIICFIVSYYLDCVDGHYARKYNMTTKFGDYFDHYSDILKILILLYCMYQKDKKMALVNTGILGVLLILMTIHFGCQQKIKNQDEKHQEPFMNMSKNFCPNPEWIKTTKHFGSGTFYLVVIMMILYTKYMSTLQ